MKSNKLILIGAGDVGGFLAYNQNIFNDKYEIIGFLDDNKDKTGKVIYGFPVLGPVNDIVNYEPGISVAICVASPMAKRTIYDKIKHLDLNFPSFVSSKTWVSNGVKVGKGCIIYPGVSINYESDLGDFVIMNMNCAIGHNCTISAFSSLAPGVNLAGFTIVGENVDLGIGSCTKQRVKIGKGSTIGGQCMLVKDVPEKSTVIGVPGKQVQQNHQDFTR